MSLIDRFCNTEYTSYEDFYENFKLNVPEKFNFAYDVVDEIAKETPDRMALVWCDETDDNDRYFTFAQMEELSAKAANVFTKMGVKKGDAVLLVLKRSYQFWYATLGLCKIGAIAIPATHLLTKKDIIYRCNAADVHTILAVEDQDIITHVNDARGECPTVKNLMVASGSAEGWTSFDDEMELASAHFPRPTGDKEVFNKDIMLLYFTSGTTGNPKMVIHNFEYPLAHIITAKFWQRLHPGSLHLTVADTGWAKCAWGKLYGQWICEATLFVYDMEKFVPKNLLHKISKHRITSFCAPPTIYRFMMQEEMGNYDLSSLEYAGNAGEALNPEIYNKFYQLTGVKMREAFGQTETVAAMATFEWMEPKPGSMGKPSPLLYTCIIDDDGNLCGPGEEGEIAIPVQGDQGPVGLFLGYHKAPELTAETWDGKYYHTGDIAWRDEEGYVYYVSRKDDVIKSSGYRIGPFEVESVLMEHPAVLETAITAVPDPVRGQIVKATIVLAAGFQPSDELKKDLQDHVKRTTAPYKYPRVIEFVDELPKTISGKIRRKALREQDTQA